MVSKKLTTGLVVAAVSAAFMVPMAVVANGKAPGGAPGAKLQRDVPAFSELDADGDGKLSVAEVLDFGAAKFAKTDSNGDGVISADEFTAAAAARAAQRAGAVFSRMLEWRDLDGDGALAPAEMSDRRGEKMFLRLDRNRDGVVSADEYDKALERRSGGRGPGRGDHPRGGN